jgi:outer membrane lipoprotein-sorting protein
MLRTIAALLALATSTAFGYTAAELATKNVEAKGGSDKIDAIKSLRLAGTLRINGDTLELALVTLVKRPHSIRSDATLQALTVVQAYDGSAAWQINPFQGRKDPERMSADDAKGFAEDAADFDGALVDYQKKGYTLDYLGTEDVDGTEAHKLRVTRPNGDITYVYLDPDAFLEIRTIDRRIEHGVPNETITDFGDYEKVDGVYIPLSREYWTKGSSDHQKIQYDKAQANVAAEDTEFQFPASHPATPAK